MAKKTTTVMDWATFVTTAYRSPTRARKMLTWIPLGIPVITALQTAIPDRPMLMRMGSAMIAISVPDLTTT